MTDAVMREALERVARWINTSVPIGTESATFVLGVVHEALGAAPASPSTVSDRARDELLERVVEALKPLANECDAVTKWNGDDPPTYSQILPPDNDWAPCFRTKYGDIRRAREALSLALGGRGGEDNSSVARLPAHVADATATDTHNHSGKEE